MCEHIKGTRAARATRTKAPDGYPDRVPIILGKFERKIDHTIC